VRISARTDYALRALVELAHRDTAVGGEALAQAQGISPKYLGSVLADLRHSNFVTSQPGTHGGYRVRDPESITVADVVRATSGPLVMVRGEWPEDAIYDAPAGELSLVWIALRSAIRSVLESVTIADLARKRLPESVFALTEDAGAWMTRDPRGQPSPANPR
jgi:Rrf2 family protein